MMLTFCCALSRGRRQLGDHVLYESSSFLNTVQVGFASSLLVGSCCWDEAINLIVPWACCFGYCRRFLALGLPVMCCSDWLFRSVPVCPQLEVHAMHMLKQGALHTLLKATEEGEPCSRELVSLHPHALASLQWNFPVAELLTMCAVPSLDLIFAAGSVPPETTAAALLYGLQRCLEAVEAAAGPLQAAEDVTTFWQRTLSGHLQVDLL
jgi:hypothetical protein